MRIPNVRQKVNYYNLEKKRNKLLMTIWCKKDQENEAMLVNS